MRKNVANPATRGKGSSRPKIAGRGKPDPRIVVRFDDEPGTGTASAPLRVRAVLAGGYDIHQAAERYKVTVRELWSVWRAVWGHAYPDMPSPEGNGSTRPTSAGRPVGVPEPIISVMRLALDLDQFVARVALFKKAAAQMGIRFSESNDVEQSLLDAVHEIRTNYVNAVFTDEPAEGHVLLGRIAAGDVPHMKAGDK